MAAAKLKVNPPTQDTPRRLAPLTHEMIAAAALRIADEKGVDGISTRRLGEELGCSHTAVYLYFATRDELLKAAFDLALEGAPQMVVREHGWEDRARAVCAAIRRTLMDHPACFELARRFPGRGIGIWEDDMNAIAAEAGYSGDDAAAVARLFTQVAIDLTSSNAVRRSWEHQEGFERFARPEEQELVLEHAQFSDEAIFTTVIDCLIDGLRRGMKLPAPSPSPSTRPKKRRQTTSRVVRA